MYENVYSLIHSLFASHHKQQRHSILLGLNQIIFSANQNEIESNWQIAKAFKLHKLNH